MLTDEKLSMFDKMKRADFRAAFMEYKNIRLDNEEIRQQTEEYVMSEKCVEDINRLQAGDYYFLVAEQFVQRTLRYAEMLCDIVHAHGFDALRGEHLHRLVDNAFFLGRGHVFSRFIRDKYNKKTHGTKKVFCFLQFFQPIMSRTSRNGDKQNNPDREEGPERRRIE